MGVFIKKIIYDDQIFFAGYSTITSRYFTPAFSDLQSLVSMKDGDSFVFSGYKTPSDIIPEDTVTLTSAEIADFFLVLSNLSANSTSSLTLTQKTTFEKIAFFILKAIGYYDGDPKIDPPQPELEAAFEDFTQTIEDIGSDRQLSDEQTKSCVVGMNYLLEKSNFTQSSHSPIDLLNRLYSKPN